MPIQYAGVNLLLEDPGGETRKWIDRFLSTAGMRLFTVPIELSEAGNTAFDIGSSAPIPNYPPWPQPKINSLYWPTGGLRWGHGFFLADDEGYQAILDALDVIGNRGSPALLKFFDSDVNPSSISGVWMYLLPARPISAYDGDGGNPLWLLPLVDQRYWWQFKPWSGSTATWASLFDDLQITLSLQNDWVDAPAPAYSAPSGVIFNQLAGLLQNSGVIVDAAAASVGMRFVLDTGFSSSIQNARIERFDSANTVLDANIVKGKTAGVIAGGEFSTDGVPVGMAANVNVGFQIADNHGFGGSYTNATGGDVDGTAKLDIIRVSANSSSGNIAWQTALAAQLADDYAGWSSRLYDFTFAGIVDWKPCGFDDYIEWFVGRRAADGKYQMHTRVRSMPHNFGVKTVAVARVGTDLDTAGAGVGCCAGCIDKKYLTVHVGTEYFMQEYYATNIPTRWGADSSGRITLSYIGVTSGIANITDGTPYWQSPTFTITCAAGSDTYFWRLFYPGVLNGSSNCFGPNGPYLYPVRVGSTSVCEDLTATLCDNTTLVYLFSGYAGGWRPRCGRILEFIGANYVTSAVDDYAPCSVCVYPKLELPDVRSTCLDQLKTLKNRLSAWPVLLTGRFDSSAPVITGLNGYSFGLWYLTSSWATATGPSGSPSDISIAVVTPEGIHVTLTGFACVECDVETSGGVTTGNLISEAVGIVTPPTVCTIYFHGVGTDGIDYYIVNVSQGTYNVTDWNNINSSQLSGPIYLSKHAYPGVGITSWPLTFSITE